MRHGFQGDLVLKTNPTPTFVQSFQRPPNLLGVILDSSDIFPLMPDNKRLVELALKGLEAERSRIDEEINELKSLHMQGAGNKRTVRKIRTGIVGGSVTGHALIGSEPARKGTLTAAGRRKIAE